MMQCCNIENLASVYWWLTFCGLHLDSGEVDIRGIPNRPVLNLHPTGEAYVAPSLFTVHSVSSRHFPRGGDSHPHVAY